MVSKLKKIWKRIKVFGGKPAKEARIRQYLQNGSRPWSIGYHEYKFEFIETQIRNMEVIDNFRKKQLLPGFGLKLDERCVEYPWIFSKMIAGTNILDAGSTFNYSSIVNALSLESKRLTIFTYFPEKNCFHSKRINYVYGDLRDMPFKDQIFDVVVCQSTIEHVGMDNEIYGYTEGKNTSDQQDYLKVIDELVRVLSPKGQILLTFPYGRYMNYGFFQQFDASMLERVTTALHKFGSVNTDFFKYEKDGWRFAYKDELADVVAFNPHTGEGQLDDGAAHCRSIACIEFRKK